MFQKTLQELATQRLQVELIKVGNEKATLAQRSVAEVAAGLSLVVAVPVEGVKAVASTVGDIADAVKNNALGYLGAVGGAYVEGKAGAYAALLPELAKQLAAGQEEAAAAAFAAAVGQGTIPELLAGLKSVIPTPAVAAAGTSAQVSLPPTPPAPAVS